MRSGRKEGEKERGGDYHVTVWLVGGIFPFCSCSLVV